MELRATEVEPLLVADKEGKLEAKTIFAELGRNKPRLGRAQRMKLEASSPRSTDQTTSTIAYRPAGLPTTNRAARSAPRAKRSRLVARCVSSSRSPCPRKCTV